MNIMKKAIILSLFILLFFGLSAKNVEAQSPTPSSLINIPMMNCGNAVASDSTGRKCCPKTELTFPETGGLIDLLKGIPIVGWIVDSFNNVKTAVLQMQRSLSPLPCALGYQSTLDPNNLNCTCLTEISPSPIQALSKICDRYFINSKELGNCKSCAAASGVWTGLGCIYGDTGKFIRETVFQLAVGLAGIISLICILYAAFILQTSQGNPEKIKKGQELLTSCIMGLMLILFSVFILKLIGVNILKIPGFG